MKTMRYGFWAVLFVLIAFSGCGRGVSDEETVARVGDAILSKQDLQQRMSWEGIRPEQESEYVDRWINRELLYQEARRLNLDKSRELGWELELVEKEFMVNRLLERTFAEKIQISDEEVTSYYEKNKESYRINEDQVRAFHILTKTRAEADLALQEIRAGKDFEKVARERSTGIFKEQGGDMGYITREDVIPEVARYVFRLAEGSESPVFHSEYGYHIVKVIDKRSEGDYKPLEEVRDEIFHSLRVNKERTVYYDLLFQLQNKTKVSVNVPRKTEATADSLSGSPADETAADMQETGDE